MVCVCLEIRVYEEPWEASGFFSADHNLVSAGGGLMH